MPSLSGLTADPCAQREWERSFSASVQKGLHLERFALLNGSVFSIWHNVQAVLPRVRIQLLTTSTGARLGGIRLVSVRPRIHQPSVSQYGYPPRCRKREEGHYFSCRNAACLVDGASELDNLRKSLKVHTRDLTA